MTRTIFVAAWIVATCQATALAVPVSFAFTGHISQIRATNADQDDLSAGLAAILPFGIGAPFSGHFTYDTDVPDISSSPTLGYYVHASPQLPPDPNVSYAHDFVMNIEGLEFRLPQTAHSVVIYDNNSFRDAFIIGNSLDRGPPIYPDGWSTEGEEIVFGSSLYDDDEEAFTSDALPTNIDLSLMESAGAGYTAVGPSTLTTPLGSFTAYGISFAGDIETLVLIPEPSTMWLLWIVSMAVLTSRHCRRVQLHR